ncbi:class I SAM-dependent methyltransferase [Teichococcus oryzae]|uniref:Methyltransferase domain-containing protein n=1 Tax=Teichococcus oryzae TaxID=1608942 RepID=A0A5B2TKJ9_9PROT|nr:class I SAM-dependent methyltransferase [Pseudoroseomonas oryzae]KAA2214986.1 methyltransferase domain-containing protein [Pseudoroseomonas oryzae]
MTLDPYPADISYPPVFHREMTPPWLDAVLRGLGRQGPDFARPFRWCELGCGPGLNLAISAATHPQGHFTGIDLSAAHLAEAGAMASAGGLGNLLLRRADFAALDGEAWEPFDVIVTHGVLSWVPDEQRAAMLDFIRRFLKPGGIAYAHYMTHPGLSAAAASQQLLRRRAARGQGDAARRASEALGFLRQLAEGGAGVFVAHPQERQRLEWASRQAPAALAHELLPAHWQPFHVGEMMRDFAGAGCGYLGSATPIDNIDAVSLPAGVRPLLEGLDDPAEAETVRDLARNQSLRRDLYGRGVPALPPSAHRDAVAALRLAALPGAPASGGLRFGTPGGEVEGDAALFDPLLRGLRGRPRRVAELAALHGGAPHPAMLNQAVQMLIWSACAHPVAAAPAAPQTSWALNRHLAEACTPGWLAAPALGSAVAADEAGMLAARAVLRAPDLRDDALLAAMPEALRPAVAAWSRDTRHAWTAFGVLPAAG